MYEIQVSILSPTKLVKHCLRTNDDEDEHKRNFSGNPSYQTTLWGYRNFRNEDSQIHYFQRFSNQKQFDNENDAYEKVVN